MRTPRTMSLWEFDARISLAETIIKNAIDNDDFRGLNNLLVSTLFRYEALENYQQLWISSDALGRLGNQKEEFLEKIKIPRSGLHSTFKSLLKKLGMTRSDFVFEHSVDVLTMRLHLIKCYKDGLNLKEEYIKLGLSCPICIVTKGENKLLKSCDRNNLNDVWKEYRKAGIKIVKVRNVCGPLLEFV